jgi:PAS domain S-box-containing protein
MVHHAVQVFIQWARQAIWRAQPYPSDESLAAVFRAQQLRAITKHSLVTLPGQLLLAFALVAVLYEKNPVFMPCWLALVLSLAASAALRTWRHGRDDMASRFSFRWASTNIVCGGLVWASLPLVTMSGASTSEHLIIVLSMTCLITVSSVVFQNLPFAAISSVMSGISSLTVSMWLSDQVHGGFVFLFVALYSLIIVRNICLASADFFARLNLSLQEKQMSLSLSKQAQVIQNTNSMVFLLNKVGRITWVNSAFESISGYASHDVLGRSVTEWLDVHTGDAVDRSLWRDLLKTQKGSIERSFLTKSGQPIWLRLDVKRLIGSGKKTEGYVVFAADISEIKRATQALHAEQIRLNHIIDGTHCGTWEMDFDGGVCKLGGHWLDIIGVDTRTPLVAEGSFILDRIHPCGAMSAVRCHSTSMSDALGMTMAVGIGSERWARHRFTARMAG